MPDVAYARNLGLPAIDINDNPYEAVEGLIGGIGNALTERKAHDDDAALSEAGADFYETAANQASARGLNGAASPDGATAPDNGPADPMLSLNDALEKRYEFWASKYPHLRVELRRRFAKMRLATMGFEISREAGARAANAMDLAHATVRQLAEIAHLHPGNIAAVRDEARDLRAALPPAYHDLFAAREAEINEAYVRGLIDKNPKFALKTLNGREDLKLSEPLRGALRHEAERAVQAERDGDIAAHENARIALRVDIGAKLAQAERTGAFPRDVYGGLRDAYKLDHAMGRDLEAKLDAAHVRALTRAERHNTVGRALVEGTPLTWDADHLESLDHNIEAVANDGDDETTANHRRVRMAIIAGTTPQKLQDHIRQGLRASDWARRADSVHMIETLQTADETLTSWLPTDLRTVAHHFTALTGTGYGDAEAFKRLDAANSLTPEKSTARRHHFDTYVRIDDLTGAVARTFNVTPSAIAEDDMQTLEYRSARDTAKTRPLRRGT